MAEGGDAEDRTEAATPHRLALAREEGDVPISPELASLAGLGAATLALALVVPGAARMLMRDLAGIMANAGQWHVEQNGAALLKALALPMLLLVAPVVLAVMIAGAGATLLQSGFLLRSNALMPDLSRLDPRRGLSRIVGVEPLVEAGRSLAKVGLLAFILWHSLAGALPLLRMSMLWEPMLLARRMAAGVLHLAIMLVVAQIVIAGLDYLWSRLRYSRRLRMSREDIRQESKETDGNPVIKAKLRALRRGKAKRMMAAVPKAAVVVTNPTHYAVALAYERGTNAAPRVVAKGADAMAATIRAVAKEHNVPLVPNPPLARALYKVELNAEIPAEHFKAVAEIIAYVWRLDRGVQRQQTVPGTVR